MAHEVNPLRQDLASYARLVYDAESGMSETELIEKINAIHVTIKQHLGDIHSHPPASAEGLRNVLSELHQVNAEVQKLTMKIDKSLVTPESKIAFVRRVKDISTEMMTVGREIELKVVELARPFTLEDLIPLKQAMDLTESMVQTFRETLHNPEQTYEAFAAMPFTHQRDPRILALIRTIPRTPPSHASSPEALKGASLIFNQQIEDLLITINPTLPMNADTETALRDLIDVLMTFSHSHVHTNMQSNLAVACRYLANHYRKNGRHEEANRYMLMPSEMKLLPTHPLGNLDELRTRTEHGQVVWAHADSTTVRRRQMRVCQRRMDPQSSPTLDFSCALPQTMREELEQHLAHLQTTDQMVVNRETLVRYHKKAMEGEDVYDPAEFLEVGSATELSTPDRRIVVTIGSDPVKWTQYQKVMVKVANGVSSQELFTFLSHIGLSTLMVESRLQDEMMERVTRLGAAKDPGTAALHTASPEGCARLFIEADPTLLAMAMEMVPQDVGGGHMESVDLEAIRRFTTAGGAGFGATLGCAPGRRTAEERALGLDYFMTLPAEEAAVTLANVLQDGFLSAMERLERGILTAGRCPTVCIETGSANQVFVRPLSGGQFTSQFEWGRYSIRGSILVLLNPDAAARMPYTYPSDLSGLRNLQIYRTEPRSIPREEAEQPGLKGHMMSGRLTLPALVERQERDGPLLTAETMFEDVLGTQYIMGAVVETEDDKRAVISVLQARGITQIAGQELEKAIFVGARLSTDIEQGLMRRSL